MQMHSWIHRKSICRMCSRLVRSSEFVNKVNTNYFLKVNDILIYSCVFPVQGCRSDNECANTEACVNGKCASPCRCGVNAICDVINHRASCKCLQGYTGNPLLGCEPPVNPCVPNPCGTNALCEIDNGSPICFCPKGLTGNPFKNCSKYNTIYE